MRNSRISAAWLSDEMAHALAAMWPPLDAADVMRAADELTSHPTPSPGVRLLRDDADAAIEPGMVEALRALHDLVA
ncbi:MAG TPA: hypothetical protein VKV73_24600 [Chloroflexota bacterium]|nr:hypothetical protein [Chloroflexota bacterium]